MPASYAAHRAQLEALLTAWGMKPEFAERTAEVMSWADLHGIDSHGISMVPLYYERSRNGRVNMAAEPRVLKETPVSALLDGDGGLGHEPGRQAMELAIAKARGDRRRRGRRAQLVAFRRRRVLHPHGGRCRAGRHVGHLRVGDPGGAHIG